MGFLNNRIKGVEGSLFLLISCQIVVFDVTGFHIMY